MSALHHINMQRAKSRQDILLSIHGRRKEVWVEESDEPNKSDRTIDIIEMNNFFSRVCAFPITCHFRYPSMLHRAEDKWWDLLTRGYLISPSLVVDA